MLTSRCVLAFMPRSGHKTFKNIKQMFIEIEKWLSGFLHFLMPSMF